MSFRKTERSVQVPPVDASSASPHTILVLLISVHTCFYVCTKRSLDREKIMSVPTETTELQF